MSNVETSSTSDQMGMEPAFEMLFQNVHPNIVYMSKKSVPLPRADEDGRYAKGNVLYMLTTSQDETIQTLQRDYLEWGKAGYKWYLTDVIFKGKIGKKRFYINNTAAAKRNFENKRFSRPLRYVTQGNKASRLQKEPNIICDLGEWHKLYFQNAFKVTIPIIVQKYVTFLAEKINSPDFNGYESRIVYVPLDIWFRKNGHVLSFRRNGLDNPLTILLFAAYRYEEVLAQIPRGTQFIFADPINDQFILIPIEMLTKKNFQKIKARIQAMRTFRWDPDSEKMLDIQFSPEEMDEDSDINNDISTPSYPDPKGVIPKPGPGASAKEWTEYHLKVKNRNRLINDAKRSLLGHVNEDKKQDLPAATSQAGEKPKVADDLEEAHTGPAKKDHRYDNQSFGKEVKSISATGIDLTRDEEVYEDDDIELQARDETPITIDMDGDLDDEIMAGVDTAIQEMQEEDPDVLLNEEGNLTAAQVSAAVQNQLRKSFMPELSEAQKKTMAPLQEAQKKVIRKPTTIQKAKSKIIKPKDFSTAINTSNEAIKSSKYANFDRAYNEQKMADDIDSAVAVLSKATSPVFVVDKVEKDTSDPLNLKKEIDYTLRDTFGGTHHVKIEVPIILEDNYIYVNGSKMVLGHQQVLMPLVKIGSADIQVCSWYNKMTIRRAGFRDPRSAAIKRFMEKNASMFELVPGNALNKNLAHKYPSTLDIDMYARNFYSFRFEDRVFILDQEKLIEYIARLSTVKVESSADHIPVGYDRGKKTVIYVTSDTTLTDIIMGEFSEKNKAAIMKMTGKTARKMLRSTVKVGGKFIPLAMLLFFFEGFTEVMKKADILYHIVPRDDNEALTYDKSQFGIFELADGYILWERNPIWNSMLLNGLANFNFSEYEIADLDSRETWGTLLGNYYSRTNITLQLMQFYDFMIDPTMEEILEDFDLPTDLVSLLLVANKMLATNDFTSVSSAPAVRIRSNEIISEMVYKEVTAAYMKFRATEYKANMSRKKPDRIACKPGAVIKKLVNESALTSEVSDLNPILTMEQRHSVTPRGPSGINMARAMTLQKRAFDKSMLGIQGITTSPDGKVGISRQLTLEPNITSVRGYLKEMTEEEIDQASAAQLLTANELLSPPGVLHDDGPRIAMSAKQTQYMIPVEGSCPVYFGNKVEAALPYHLDNNFTIVAKDAGEVIEIKEGIIVVQYKDGTKQAIDTNKKMKKNSSGFFTQTYLESHLTEVGQKFKKNEVIAYDPRAFTKNEDDLSASMNIGVPVKVAILPNFDSYEDASPITTSLSKKFTTRMSMREGVGIPAHSFVQSMMDIGDTVEVDDPLIVYDPAHEDDAVNDFIDKIRAQLGEDMMKDLDIAAMPKVRSSHAGTIVNIEVYSSVDPSELSPSLKEIFMKYTQHGENVNKILNRNKNDTDLAYYKCGQLVKSAREIVTPSFDNRVKGYKIGDDGKGIVIIFYIEFVDIAKTADKGSAYTALKFTTSHVIPEGREPYSEYREDEDICAILSPCSLIARKTPSIWETMALNKVLIEMTRHSLDIFFNDTDGKGKGPKYKA